MSATLTPQAKASSHKVYVDGRSGIRVPMRQIHLTDGTSFRVYDTSGVHTDPGLDVDVRRGLPALRAKWIDGRGDVDELPRPTSSYRRERDVDASLNVFRFPSSRTPRRAKA